MLILHGIMFWGWVGFFGKWVSFFVPEEKRISEAGCWETRLCRFGWAARGFWVKGGGGWEKAYLRLRGGCPPRLPGRPGLLRFSHFSRHQQWDNFASYSTILYMMSRQ